MIKKAEKQYQYNYPEQIKISEGLEKGDRKIIAEKTGYSFEMIIKMCKGVRKMTPKVEKYIKLITIANNAKEKIINEIQVEQELED